MRVTRLLSVLASVSLGLAAFATAASAASAAPTTSAEVTGAHATLTAVSCPSKSFCLAVGSHLASSGVRHSLAEEWNGEQWLVLNDPPGSQLLGLSCPSSSFCLAVGSRKGNATNLAETFNRRTWRIQSAPARPQTDVSCAGSKLCMIVDDTNDVAYWTGSGQWKHFTGENAPCSIGPLCTVSAVSCGATSCMAVGKVATSGSGDSYEGFTNLWNGKKWTLLTVQKDPILSVTCSRVGYCMTAFGDNGQHEVYDPGQGWSSANGSKIGAGSCAGLYFCAGVSKTALTASDSEPNWSILSLARPPLRSHLMFGISCATESFCMAVGTYFTRTQNWGWIERFKGYGTGWFLSKSPFVS